ncbi:DUF4179 domain-containing protein [Cytobacillus citreus]|nr:DUF4179 domain-containing protein [Cytobacillus citreus]
MGGYMNRDKKLRNSELFEEVSFNADDRHQVHTVLKERKVRRNVFGKGKRALVPVIIGIMILCAGIYLPSNPVLALSKLPFFESIFQFFGDSGLKDATKENKQNVQHQKSEDGMSMEIQEAVYDGKRLSISYVIKSEKPIKNYTSRMVNFYIPFDGFQKGGYISNDQFKQVSDHEVIGYSTFTSESEMPNDIMVDFVYKGTTDYTSDKQKEFKFLFEVPIKKTTKIDTVVFNKKKSFGEEELKLKQISLSPISTVINLQYKAPYQNNPDDVAMSIRLLDQDNRIIKEVPNRIGWFGTQIKENNRWYTLKETNILFEPLDKEIEEIKIQLFKNENQLDILTDTKVKLIALPEAKNQLLNLGERGTMKITDIKQEEDSAVIRYEYNSSFAFYYNLSPLVLKSADGNWHHGIEMERKYLGNETYMVEELFLDLPKDKLEVRYLQEKAPELIEELEIKVSSDEIKNGIKVQ